MNLIETNPAIRDDLNTIIQADLPCSDLAKKTILVTGGSGFLASYLVRALLEADHNFELNLRVIVVNRDKGNSSSSRLGSYFDRPNLEILQCDLNTALPSKFPHADFIIHAASQASPKFFGTDPVGTLKTNSIGTMNLLEHAAKNKAEKFLFFSSSEVYGQQSDPNQEISETDYGYLDSTKVRSCYAESKRMGETMCVAWAHQYGLNTAIVRPFHTYGPGMSLNDGRVFADLVADAVAKRDIVVKSDGLARRPFCYISDATRGFLTVLLKGESGQAYNIANQKAEVSIKQLAETISSLFPERKLRVRYETLINNNEYLKSPITSQIPSIEKAESLGWSPTIDINTGFKRTVLSYDE